MSGWNSSRPPWETQDQPALPPDEGWYGGHQGPRVVIKPHQPGRGSRAARADGPAGSSHRGAAMVGALVGLVIAGGIVYGAVRLTQVTWGQPPAAPPASPTAPASPSNEASTGTSGASLTSPAASASATAQASAGAGAAAPFTLTAPRSAGSYSLASPMSATVKAVGSAGATQLITTVKAAGGTTSASVSGQYLIAGDQYLGYTGYNGAFTPGEVLQAFGAGATGVTTEPAGSHGGQLACGQVKATSPSAMSGEACVWATTSTVAMVEFYGGGGSALEAVLPAKAGADALEFRAAVEAARS